MFNICVNSFVIRCSPFCVFGTFVAILGPTLFSLELRLLVDVLALVWATFGCPDTFPLIYIKHGSDSLNNYASAMRVYKIKPAGIHPQRPPNPGNPAKVAQGLQLPTPFTCAGDEDNMSSDQPLKLLLIATAHVE